MSQSKDFVLSAEFLESVNLTPEQVAIELAVYLYAQKRMTMGQAREMANLDQLAFQHELAKREVYIHYDWEDIEQDLKNLGIEL